MSSDKRELGRFLGGKPGKPADEKPAGSGLVRKPSDAAVEKPPAKTSTLAAKFARVAQQASDKERRQVVQTHGRKKGKFLLALDASGSMMEQIEGAKRIIGMLIARVHELAEGAEVLIRVIAFRDYYNREQLMDISELSDDPTYLEQFLGGVRSIGNTDWDEAVEAPLQHALDEGEYDAVILAGDAVSHSRSYLDRNELADKLTAQELAEKFGEAGIPIHTFVVGSNSETVDDFTAIANSSGGETSFLREDDELLNMAAMAMLERMKGAEAVRAYLAQHNPTGSAREFGQRLLLTEGNKREG